MSCEIQQPFMRKKINALELEPLKREYDESCSVMKRPSNKILRLQKYLLCNVSAQ